LYDKFMVATVQLAASFLSDRSYETRDGLPIRKSLTFFRLTLIHQSGGP
jgi:hypothetical protein